MIDDQDDAFHIPAFLRREMTPEIAARIKRLTTHSRQRKIKNPPKRVSKRQHTGLGLAFGMAVRGGI